MTFEQSPVFGHEADKGAVLQLVALAAGLLFIVLSLAGVTWWVGAIGITLVILNSITIGGSILDRRHRA